MQFFFCLLLFFLSFAFATAQTYLFVGTYTDGKPDKGIYVYEFNSKNGTLKRVSTTENITNPSFLMLSPDGRFLYACTETKTPNAGSISAFAFDSTSGKLQLLNKQPSGGENPVYVNVFKNGKFVISGNYTAGNISVFKTNDVGSLQPFSQLINFDGSGIHAERQDKSHIHAAVFSPDYKYMFLLDLGADKIRVFAFDSTSTEHLLLKENISTFPGSGPRHLTFHPNGKFAYCIEELSGTISVCSYEDGKLDSIQHVFSYSQKQEIYNSADIHVSPDGQFLYASNRWDDNTISIFTINQQTGKLTLKSHQQTYGEHPRNFTINPTGNFLLVANQLTDNIVVFKRNMKTGLLKKVREIRVPQPSCLQMRTFAK